MRMRGKASVFSKQTQLCSAKLVFPLQASVLLETMPHFREYSYPVAAFEFIVSNCSRDQVNKQTRHPRLRPYEADLFSIRKSIIDVWEI